MLASKQEGFRFDSGPGTFFVGSLHVLIVPGLLWVLHLPLPNVCKEDWKFYMYLGVCWGANGLSLLSMAAGRIQQTLQPRVGKEVVMDGWMQPQIVSQ